MKRFYLYFCLFIACLAVRAQEVTIIPQFAVGDTLRYQSASQVMIRNGKEWMMVTLRMRPTLVVDSMNDEGFIVSLSTDIDSLESKASDPDAAGLFSAMAQSEFISSIIELLDLKIQLQADGRPKSIVNINDVIDGIVDVLVNAFMEKDGLGVVEAAMVRMEVVPRIKRDLRHVYTKKYMIDCLFDNIPYFTFYGIPLESGPLHVDTILSEQLKKMLHMDFALNMEVSRTGEDIGDCSIRFSGSDETSKVEGKMDYIRGIVQHGWLSVSQADDDGRIETNYILERIP